MFEFTAASAVTATSEVVRKRGSNEDQLYLNLMCHLQDDYIYNYHDDNNRLTNN